MHRHYGHAVRVLLAMTWRSVLRSNDMPSQTITYPPPNRSWWYRQRLLTVWNLSHVLSVGLLSSIKTIGRQWTTCQFWCSVTNANRAARCWALSTGPTSGLQAFYHPHGFSFWQFVQKHATLTCWRSICEALAVPLHCICCHFHLHQSKWKWFTITVLLS